MQPTHLTTAQRLVWTDWWALIQKELGTTQALLPMVPIFVHANPYAPKRLFIYFFTVQIINLQAHESM